MTPEQDDRSPTVLTPPSRHFSPGSSLFLQRKNLVESQGHPVSTAGIIAMELCALLCEPGAIESLGNGMAPLEETVGASAALLAQYLGHKAHLSPPTSGGVTPIGLRKVKNEAAQREAMHQVELHELGELRVEMDEQLRLASEALVESQRELHKAQQGEASARRENEKLKREGILHKASAIKARGTAEDEVETLRRELSDSGLEVATLERQLLEAAKAGAQTHRALRNFESKEATLTTESSEREESLREELARLQASYSLAQVSESTSLERAQLQASQAATKIQKLQREMVESHAALAEEGRKAQEVRAELQAASRKVRTLEDRLLDSNHSNRRHALREGDTFQALKSQKESALALEEAEAVVTHLAQGLKHAQNDAKEAREEAALAQAALSSEIEGHRRNLDAAVANISTGDDIAMGAQLKVAEATRDETMELVGRSWRGWGGLLARVVRWSQSRLAYGFFGWRSGIGREKKEAKETAEAKEVAARAQTRAETAMAHIALLERQLERQLSTDEGGAVWSKQASIKAALPLQWQPSQSSRTAAHALSSPTKAALNGGGSKDAFKGRASLGDAVWEVIPTVGTPRAVGATAKAVGGGEVPWHLAYGSPKTAVVPAETTRTVAEAAAAMSPPFAPPLQTSQASPLVTSQGLCNKGIQHYRERLSMHGWLLEVTSLKTWRTWSSHRRQAHHESRSQVNTAQCARIVHCWRSWASRQRKARRAMRKGLSHGVDFPLSTKPGVILMLLAWKVDASSSRRQRRAQKKAITHRTRGLQGVGLKEWRGFNLIAMRGDHFIAQARCVIEEKRLKAGLKGWQGIAQGSAEASVRASLALVWRRRRIFHVTMRRWQTDNRRSTFKRAREERRFARAADHSLSKQALVLRAGWASWRDWYHNETKMAFLAEREKAVPVGEGLEDVMARAMREAQETTLRLRMPDGTVQSLSPSQSVEPRAGMRGETRQPKSAMGSRDIEASVTVEERREETLHEAIASTVIESISPRAQDSSVSLTPVQPSPGDTGMGHISMDEALNELQEVMEEGMLMMSESPDKPPSQAAQVEAVVVLQAGIKACRSRRQAFRAQTKTIEQATARLGALVQGQLSRRRVAACASMTPEAAPSALSRLEDLVHGDGSSAMLSRGPSLSPSLEGSTRSASRERKQYVQKSIKVADEALLQRQQWLEIKGQTAAAAGGKRAHGRPKARPLQDLTNARLAAPST